VAIEILELESMLVSVEGKTAKRRERERTNCKINLELESRTPNTVERKPFFGIPSIIKKGNLLTPPLLRPVPACSLRMVKVIEVDMILLDVELFYLS
jgi:hypothetical protein